ncbi:MAG: biotin-dependent carboxyltransferase family protein, partial [Burkholderiales bacterium]
MIRVLRPGLLTTVQDIGRHGLQHLGIVPCGGMDSVALRLANGLVGNDSKAAALEITVLGPELAFDVDALVAICGAEMEVMSGGRPVASNRPFLMSKGSTLHARRVTLGSRAYLAVAGGIAVPPVLGSRSTYMPAKFGGFGGRALKAGDVLPLADDAAALAIKRYLKLTRREERHGIR